MWESQVEGDKARGQPAAVAAMVPSITTLLTPSLWCLLLPPSWLSRWPSDPALSTYRQQPSPLSHQPLTTPPLALPHIRFPCVYILLHFLNKLRPVVISNLSLWGLASPALSAYQGWKAPSGFLQGGKPHQGSSIARYPIRVLILLSVALATSRPSSSETVVGGAAASIR